MASLWKRIKITSKNWSAWKACETQVHVPHIFIKFMDRTHFFFPSEFIFWKLNNQPKYIKITCYKTVVNYDIPSFMSSLARRTQLAAISAGLYCPISACRRVSSQMYSARELHFLSKPATLQKISTKSRLFGMRMFPFSVAVISPIILTTSSYL